MGEPPRGGPIQDGEATDAALAARYASGDPEAFREIARRHGSWLLRVMRGLLPGDPEAALDAMQEALCDAAIGLKAFRGQAGLRTLLYSYARNKAADAIRKSASERRKAAMAGRASTGLSEPSAEDAAIFSDEALRVRRALAALGPGDRAVLRLREFEGASMGEIAAVLGLSEGAAKLRLHRARKRFGRLWLREGN